MRLKPWAKHLLAAFCCVVLQTPCGRAQADPSQYLYYTVRGGDTLQSVGRAYHVSWQSIAKLNAIRRPYVLQRGQVLKIPKVRFRVIPANRHAEKPREAEIIPITFLPGQDDVLRIKNLLGVEAPEILHWRYIVIHHSATGAGNARAFGQFHSKRRRMQHGLAYHFVINNGNGGRNGNVEVGQRWKEQWPGGHTANRLMNEIGIGICLVGNFETGQPTQKQLESLVILAKLLQEQCGIPDRNVILHRHVAQRGTLCPGKKFPWDKLKKMLVGTQLPA